MSAPPAATGRRPPPDLARLVAWEVLRAVAAEGAYANLVLPRLLRTRRVEGRDAAFATELAYGALRATGTLDVVLAACSSRPLDAVDPALLDVLRLGAYQMLDMRVPAHAAVSTSVDLAAATVGEGAARFANAVLRQVAARDLGAWVTRLGSGVDEVTRVALEQKHPAWVVEAFRDALGGDLAETASALAADNIAPPVTLVARPGRATLDELVAAGARPGSFSPYAAVLAGGDPGAIPAVRQGRAGVQDEGSQLVALALAAAPVTGPDARWADLCAGPGGKAALLGGLAAARGAGLLAVELRPHRATLVARSLSARSLSGRSRTARSPAGQAGRALTVVADATVPAWAPGVFDRVLVDAPCTGLGALRRRPEARWRRTPADLDGLVPLQRALLTAALDAVRPGGLAAYVTCSPHLAETREVVAAVLDGRDDVETVDASPFLPGVPQLGDGPAVQLWPHRHGTDAMFLALLRRR